MLFEVVLVLLLMVLNGVFSAAEIAILSVRKSRIAELVESGSGGARAVQWLRSQPERFLATVQIGITVVATTAAAFGGDSLAEDFARWLSVRVPVLGARTHGLALVLVIALVSFLTIVIGELVPKSIALRSAEPVSVTLGPPLRAMASIVRPLVWVLTQASNTILRAFGDKTSFTETRLSPEELQELLEEAGRVGSIDQGTSEIASRAIDFRDLTVADVMVVREAIVAVSRSADREAIASLLTGRRFARVPVFEGDPENVIGYVALKDLLLPAIRGEPALLAQVREVTFVPSGMSASSLLRQMQRERAPIVMVTDENGGLRGLVTIEDLVEELVGDILSEGDPAPVVLGREVDGSAVVPGSTPIRDANRALGLDLPEPDGVSTIAGLCIRAAGHLPRGGERIVLADGHAFDVLDATARQVRSVRVIPPRAETAPRGEGPAEVVTTRPGS